jgi:nitrite reductase (NADH) small subunit/3-phenylpropionate/trans-cinnamate dioxygenase ferredoxin subunit
MSTFSKACAVADVAPGTAKLVAVDGKDVALFNVDGTFYALDNECPHRGGPLGEGDLEGCIVTCPWHAWQYDVRTGESITDDLKVARYDVKVEGGDVLVALD